MYKMSRDTTINQGVSDTNALAALKEHLVRVKGGGESQFIDIQTGVNDDWHVLALGEGPIVNVKPFLNPIFFNLGDDSYLIIDARNCTRYDRLNSRPVLSNPSLFRREMVRVLFESVWIGDGPNDILNMGHYQIQVFSTWIGDMFARRFALDAEQQVRITILAAFYYLCLFTEAERADLRRFIPIISKVTMTGAPFVMDTLREMEYIGNLEEFIGAVQTTLQTDRLDGLGIDVVITMLAGSWFGPNHAILVGIALEYPPMWNALLYLSLTDRSTRASGIAKVALRRERDQMAREYVAITSALLIRNSTLSPEGAQGAK